MVVKNESHTRPLLAQSGFFSFLVIGLSMNLPSQVCSHSDSIRFSLPGFKEFVSARVQPPAQTHTHRAHFAG